MAPIFPPLQATGVTVPGTVKGGSRKTDATPEDNPEGKY